MRLNWIRLQNFRSYSDQKFEFHPHLNFIIGPNAQGKTNLIEAIYYLSMLKSFRLASPKDMLRLGQEQFHIQAEVTKSDVEWDFDITHNGTKRSLLLNTNKVKNSAEFLGKWVCLTLIPDHIQIIQSSPGLRRNLLDHSIFLSDPAYLTRLNRYQRTLKQKSSLIKECGSYLSPEQKDQLDIWNAELASQGAYITQQRHHFTESIVDSFDKHYAFVSGQHAHVSINYAPTLSHSEDHALQQLEEIQSRELAARQCLVGPQRDDVEIMIDGNNIKHFGSQGQKRSFLIAYRLMDLERIKGLFGYAPAFLVDDLGADLDRQRTERFFQRVLELGSQLFITTTDERVTQSICSEETKQEGFQQFNVHFDNQNKVSYV